MFIRLVGKLDQYVNLRNVTHLQLCGSDPEGFGKGERVIFHFTGGESLIVELPAHEVARLQTALAGLPADAPGEGTAPPAEVGGSDDTARLG